MLRYALLLFACSLQAQHMARRLGFDPPAIPDWRPLENPVAGYDLNGTWELESGAFMNRFAILQLRDAIVISSFDQENNIPPDTILVKGQYRYANTIAARAHPYGLHEWFDTAIRVDDDDHIRIDSFVTPYRTFPAAGFRRTSRAAVRDLPCDPNLPTGLSPRETNLRATIYANRDELSLSACWNFLGANAGDPHAEAEYGSNLFNGRGVDRNPADAALWFQVAAMQGDSLAAVYLAKMFEEGIALPQSHQRSVYWNHRVEATLPGEDAPAWARMTSTLCDASYAEQTSALDALDKGRVAFMARALKSSACWFTISASKGNIKAKTFLGIQNVFGLGIPANPKAGFDYMHEAARNNDWFACAYLSLFYDYGIGTPKDPDTAGRIERYVFGKMTASDMTPVDAWKLVHGTSMTVEQGLASVLGGLMASQSEAACEAENERQRSRGLGYIPKPCADAASDADGPVAQNQLENPEEIYPEFTPYPL